MLSQRGRISLEDSEGKETSLRIESFLPSFVNGAL